MHLKKRRLEYILYKMYVQNQGVDYYYLDKCSIIPGYIEDTPVMYFFLKSFHFATVFHRRLTNDRGLNLSQKAVA